MFGEAVYQRFLAHGIEPDAVSWDARRRQDGIKKPRKAPPKPRASRLTLRTGSLREQIFGVPMVESESELVRVAPQVRHTAKCIITENSC